MSSATAPDALAEPLRGLCDGSVHLPGDLGDDLARVPWNTAVDQRPAAVAQPSTTADVVAVVPAARNAGLRVAPQGTGHNGGPLGPLDDVVLMRTSAMTGVKPRTSTFQALGRMLGLRGCGTQKGMQPWRHRAWPKATGST